MGDPAFPTLERMDAGVKRGSTTFNGGTAMKMKAAILFEQGLPAPYAQSKPLRVEEVDLAPPGPGELLIKTGAAGLCHSDLS